MTLEEQLKDIILTRYKSIRAFTQAANIPYSTVDSMLKNSIAKSGVSKVIRIFDALGLDVESIQTGIIREKEKPLDGDKSTSRGGIEMTVMQDFRSLTREQQEVVLALIETIASRNQQKASADQRPTAEITEEKPLQD